MKTSVIVTMATIAIGLAACTSNSHNPAHRAPGTYESERVHTSSSGTTYKTKEVTDVKVDQYGNKKATVETEVTKDPKGLMNKSTSSTKKTYIE
jgi:hypothetical protein